MNLIPAHQQLLRDWPYPRWIAHRGAGKLAPENTLAAFRLGAQHGYRAYECDVKLSSDDVCFLLHDATLNRTTSGHGDAGSRNWHDLSQLDAGSWHSRASAGEMMPTLSAVAAWVRAQGHALNIEIKPSPGRERETGEKVAREAARLWAGDPVPPLLSSFQVESLEGALAAQPELPRALLLDQLVDGWFETAQRLQCVAVVMNHALVDSAIAARVHGAGLKLMVYTVNDPAAARRMMQLGIDGIITDRVDRYAPGAANPV